MKVVGPELYRELYPISRIQEMADRPHPMLEMLKPVSPVGELLEQFLLASLAAHGVDAVDVDRRIWWRCV